MSSPYYSRTETSPPDPSTFYASPPHPPPIGGATPSAPPDPTPYSLSPSHFHQPPPPPLFHPQVESTNQSYPNRVTNQTYSNATTNQPYAKGVTNQCYSNATTNQSNVNGVTNQPYPNVATNQSYANGASNQQYLNGATTQPSPNGPTNQAHPNGPTNQHYPNGAYYTPHAPPTRPARSPSPPPSPSKTDHCRKHNNKGHLCWNPCCCCGCLMTCLMTCICQIICVVLVIVAILILICWLIFRPTAVKFYATDASLTEFDLKDNTLQYNLALNLTIRNPNRRIGIYYDKIEANAIYQGERFATTQLQPFFQHHKSTNSLSPEFKGQNLVTLRNKQLSHYNDDKGSGVYAIDVKLYLRLRLKFLSFKLARLKPKINCDLRIPLNGVATSKVYESKRCNLIFRL
ncbi:hypothetical protein BUALT_Bualt11G0089300 [Buddleja alternifolia]|uniref:Late embryogenesis abundant protein LEA-2 subgroup domain-containing protein n=1 Tax=Buddleja alternifolia TaxID=168488 RepID=A0AAV6WZZ9_9LAMI|nr:hypothetical protein BUALT_Bualt11G0089300 [Buddleja alternifolia]